MLLKIGSLDCSDFLADLKISYETLVSDESGRNANGDMVLDILGEKDKVQIKTRPLQKDIINSYCPLCFEYHLYEPRNSKRKNNSLLYKHTNARV